VLYSKYKNDKRTLGFQKHKYEEKNFNLGCICDITTASIFSLHRGDISCYVLSHPTSSSNFCDSMRFYTLKISLLQNLTMYFGCIKLCQKSQTVEPIHVITLSKTAIQHTFESSTGFAMSPHILCIFTNLKNQYTL
jgi:hypothetical protein